MVVTKIIKRAGFPVLFVVLVVAYMFLLFAFINRVAPDRASPNIAVTIYVSECGRVRRTTVTGRGRVHLVQRNDTVILNGVQIHPPLNYYD